MEAKISDAYNHQKSHCLRFQRLIDLQIESSSIYRDKNYIQQT